MGSQFSTENVNNLVVEDPSGKHYRLQCIDEIKETPPIDEDRVVQDSSGNKYHLVPVAHSTYAPPAMKPFKFTLSS